MGTCDPHPSLYPYESTTWPRTNQEHQVNFRWRRCRDPRRWANRERFQRPVRLLAGSIAAKQSGGCWRTLAILQFVSNTI